MLFIELLENISNVSKWFIHYSIDYFVVQPSNISKNLDKINACINRINFCYKSGYSSLQYFYLFRYIFDNCKNVNCYIPLKKLKILDDISVEDIIDKLPKFKDYWDVVEKDTILTKGERTQAFNMLIELKNIFHDFSSCIKL